LKIQIAEVYNYLKNGNLYILTGIREKIVTVTGLESEIKLKIQHKQTNKTRNIHNKRNF